MSEPIVGESHDGMDPLRLYTKIVETLEDAIKAEKGGADQLD